MPAPTEDLTTYINLKLAALGQPVNRSFPDFHLLEIAHPLLRNYYQKDRRLGDSLCPADSRIQAFLDSYLKDAVSGRVSRLPSRSFELDRPGLARIMSLPPDRDSFASPFLRSYRVPQGVLHNP